MEAYEKINKIALEVLNLARNTLVINLRFMDKPISMLRCEMSALIKEISVDGARIIYNPVYVLKTFKKERAMVARQYLHMIFHCVFRHYWIDTLMDKDYWNLASDIAAEAAINDLDIPQLAIADASRQLQETESLKNKVKYLTADCLYRYFQDEKMPHGEVERLEGIFHMDSHDIWYKKESDEDDGSDMEAKKSILDEWGKVAEQIRVDIETFERYGRGTEAGALTQNLLAVTREKYDYSSFLKRFAVLGEKMKINDEEFDYIFYTYGLNIYGNMPLIEPLEYKEAKQVRELVIAIDTSGSTSGDLVQNFLKKTYNILKQAENFFTKFNVHIIQCDAEIQEDAKITSQQEFDSYIASMKIRGLGGTDFRPVFSYVDELVSNKEFYNLKGLIYFTDGYGVFPKKKPAYNVAVVYLQDGYENPPVPPWAIKLVLSEEDIKEMEI